jgi:hypothetical protein
MWDERMWDERMWSADAISAGDERMNPLLGKR